MSSRGRSLALADRLAVSLATTKRLPSAKESALVSPLEPYAGELARAVLRGGSVEPFHPNSVYLELNMK